MSVALDTTSTYFLEYSSTKTLQYKTKEIQFGDGYRQILLDGINYDQEEWSLQFAPLPTTSANTLEGILANSVNGTAKYLAWTPHGEATTKYWTATDINKTGIANGYWSISCRLRREFPLS